MTATLLLFEKEGPAINCLSNYMDDDVNLFFTKQ